MLAAVAVGTAEEEEDAMKFLKSAKHSKAGFSATFTNGEKTTSHEVASFFMVMQDKNAEPSEVHAYVRMGQMVEPWRDWSEIQRIANSFVE